MSSRRLRSTNSIENVDQPVIVRHGKRKFVESTSPSSTDPLPNTYRRLTRSRTASKKTGILGVQNANNEKPEFQPCKLESKAGDEHHPENEAAVTQTKGFTAPSAVDLLVCRSAPEKKDHKGEDRSLPSIGQGAGILAGVGGGGPPLTPLAPPATDSAVLPKTPPPDTRSSSSLTPSEAELLAKLSLPLVDVCKEEDRKRQAGISNRINLGGTLMSESEFASIIVLEMFKIGVRNLREKNE